MCLTSILNRVETMHLLFNVLSNELFPFNFSGQLIGDAKYGEPNTSYTFTRFEFLKFHLFQNLHFQYINNGSLYLENVIDFKVSKFFHTCRHILMHLQQTTFENTVTKVENMY